MEQCIPCIYKQIKNCGHYVATEHACSIFLFGNINYLGTEV